MGTPSIFLKKDLVLLPQSMYCYPDIDTYPAACVLFLTVRPIRWLGWFPQWHVIGSRQLSLVQSTGTRGASRLWRSVRFLPYGVREDAWKVAKGKIVLPTLVLDKLQNAYHKKDWCFFLFLLQSPVGSPTGKKVRLDRSPIRPWKSWHRILHISQCSMKWGSYLWTLELITLCKWLE